MTDEINWLNKTKEDFANMARDVNFADDRVLEGLVLSLGVIKTDIKNQIISIVQEYDKVVKLHNEYQRCGRAVRWNVPVKRAMDHIFALHGHTWEISESLRGFNGMHPSAPGVVWLGIRKMLDVTRESEMRDVADGVNQGMVMSVKKSDDLDTMLSMFNGTIQMLYEFEVNVYGCIDDVVKYMKVYDKMAPSPLERMCNINTETNHILTMIMMLYRMTGAVA